MSALLQVDLEEARTSGSVSPIGIEFRFGDRFLLRQVRKEGHIALYEKSKDGQPRGFEVVVLRIRPAETLFGRSYPLRESYPSNEDWGIYGWSYAATDLKGAQRRFERLLRMPIAVGGIGEDCDFELCPLP
jgi:hypothetical protein